MAYWMLLIVSQQYSLVKTKINSYLNNGPIRDFNVIYDPVQICAEVKVVTKAFDIGSKQNLDCIYALYCLAGTLTVNNAKINKGSLALGRALPEQLQYSQNSVALLVSLVTLSER